MATVTAVEREPVHVPEARLTNPLNRLSWMIRAYVIIEGLATCAIVVALWFWATLFLDWASYGVLNFDYVRDGDDRGFVLVIYRGFFFAALLLALVFVIAFRLVYRLAASFSTNGLALALERRYPRVFGDRLMTAIELGDQRLARRFGFSWVMIEQTRDQALERIDKVDVGKLLNWSRLFAYLAITVVLMLTIVGFAFAATNTASLWWNRTMAFGDRHWPRSIMIDLPDFRSGPTKSVPSGSEYRLTAEAWEYVVFTNLRDEKGKKVYFDDHRPVEWYDLFPGQLPGVYKNGELTESNRSPDILAWELKEPVWDRSLYDALPEEWQTLTLDQISARMQVIRETPNKSEAVLWKAELGQAILRKVRQQIQRDGKVDAVYLDLLPSEWRGYEMKRTDGRPYLDDYLIASQYLTAGETGELKRLQALIKARNLLAPQQINAVNTVFVFPQLDPVPWLGQCLTAGPAFNWIVDQKQTSKSELDNLGEKWADPMFFRRDLSESDRAMLPKDWTDKGDALHARLETYGQKYLPQHLGAPMVAKLNELFATLDQREQTSRSSWGTRRYFRKLLVPESIRFSWKDNLSDEERGRNLTAKSAAPLVERDSVSYRYYFDKFGKIEIAKQFCVTTKNNYQITPWYNIDVRELPTLVKMWKIEEWQPGYLHGGNARYRTHPAVGVDGKPDKERDDIPLMLGAAETVIREVPVGTQLTFGARTKKPLQNVRITATAQRSEDLWSKAAGQAVSTPAQAGGLLGMGGPLDICSSLIGTNYVENKNLYVHGWDFTPGSDEFIVRLKEFTSEEVSLRLEFWDTDGIKSSRTLVFRAKKDSEPAFDMPPTGAEHVRSQAITNLAIIPFSVELRDDHGLTMAGYEVTVIKDGQKIIDGRFYPFRRLSAPINARGYPKNLVFEKGAIDLRDPFADGRLTIDQLLATHMVVSDAMLKEHIKDEKKHKQASDDTMYTLGDLSAIQFALANAPNAGLMTLAQGPLLPSRCPSYGDFDSPRSGLIELPRVLSHKHYDYPAHKPPIEIFDEFFDTAELLGYEPMSDPTDSRTFSTNARRVPLGNKRPPAQDGFFGGIHPRVVANYLKPPYQLQIRFVAKDNRVKSVIGPDGEVVPGEVVAAPQKAYSPKALIFEVKHELFLLGDEYEREAALAERFLGLINELRDQRRLLQTIASEYSRNKADPDPNKDEFIRAQRLVEQTRRTTIEIGAKVDNDMIKAFRDIYRDVALNRVQYELQQTNPKDSAVMRLDKFICQPLEEIAPRSIDKPSRFPKNLSLFDTADAELKALAEAIGDKRDKLAAGSIDDAGRKLDILIVKLNDVYEYIKKLEDFSRMVQLLGRIKDDQDKLNAEIKKYLEEMRKKELNPDPPKP